MELIGRTWFSRHTLSIETKADHDVYMHSRHPLSVVLLNAAGIGPRPNTRPPYYTNVSEGVLRNMASMATEQAALTGAEPETDNRNAADYFETARRITDYCHRQGIELQAE